MASISKAEIRLPPWGSMSFWELTCESFLDSRNLSATYDCQVEGDEAEATSDAAAGFRSLHSPGACIKFYLLSDRQSDLILLAGRLNFRGR